MTVALPPLPILSVGETTTADGRPVGFSKSDLYSCAAAYDAAIFEAPLVVGEPAMSDPAYGWIAGLKAEGGRLWASSKQVHPRFADMVARGSFRGSSATFYSADSPNNPRPGRMYLKHVSFAGAAAPQLTGLKMASFVGSSAGALTFVMDAGYTLSQRISAIRNEHPSLSSSDARSFAVSLCDIDRLEAAQETTSFAETSSAERTRAAERFQAARDRLAQRFLKRHR